MGYNPSAQNGEERDLKFAWLAQDHVVRRSGFGLCKPMAGLYSLI